MSSNQVIDILDRIASTPSKLEKEQILAANVSDLMKQVIAYALDPFFVTGVAEKTILSLRYAGTPGGREFSTDTFSLLARLDSGQLSGTAALEALQAEFDALNTRSAELLTRVLLKNLRAGFGDGTVEKVLPGFLPSYPYMRCSLPDKSNMEKWDWSAGVISQEKADGMFVNINRRGDAVTLTTRQGTPVPLNALPGFEDEAVRRLTQGTQTHGELLVFEGGQELPREKGNGILNSILKGGALEPCQIVRAKVWDQIPLESVKNKGKCGVIYENRLHALVRQLSVVRAEATDAELILLVPTRIVYSKAKAFEHYRELLREGKEGTIVKSPDATWKDGTSKDQVKLKLEVDVDLVITGINQGRVGTKNEGLPGAFACATSCGALVVDVTIKNEALRAQVQANPGEFVGKVIAVRANGVMSPSVLGGLHSLFLPRMVEASYRTDKTVADSLEQVQDQFRNAVA